MVRLIQREFREAACVCWHREDAGQGLPPRTVHDNCKLGASPTGRTSEGQYVISESEPYSTANSRSEENRNTSASPREGDAPWAGASGPAPRTAEAGQARFCLIAEVGGGLLHLCFPASVSSSRHLLACVSLKGDKLSVSFSVLLPEALLLPLTLSPGLDFTNTF